MLELIASHFETASHRYKDYPFIHTPIWWNRFLTQAIKHELKPIERFHKDGLKVTPESPEAMEEIIWMTFFHGCHNYEEVNILTSDHENTDFERFYRNHIKKILFIRKGSRYLTKNNYNVSRLSFIKKAFPDAKFLITIRNPVNHLASLIRQHQIFHEAERSDSRISDYLKQVGHFEFGSNRIPINFGKPDLVELIKKLWNIGDEVHGWLKYWILVYEYIYNQLSFDKVLRQATLVINYDALCKSPFDILKNLYDHIELKINHKNFIEQASRITTPNYYSLPFSGDDVSTIKSLSGDLYDRIINMSS